MVMKIEVRSLKHFPSLSEETTAYTATIYVDGKKAIDAKNDGHGGMDMYRPIAPFTFKDIENVNAWLKATKPAIVSGDFTHEHDLEWEVGQQIDIILSRKQLDRMVRTKLVVIVDNTVQTYPAKHKPTPANIAALKARGEKVVNGDDTLYEEALAILTN
jgi:hypothetical protein